MKELLSQITHFTGTLSQVAKDRIKNPIINSFVISWIIWNWKPITIFIFSKSLIEDKITLISTQYNNISYLFLYPLYSALFLYLLMPYISIAFEYILNIAKRHNQKEETQRKISILQGELNYERTEKELRNITLDNKQIENFKSKIDLREKQLSEERDNNSKLLEEIEVNNKNVETLQKRTLKDKNTIESLLNSLDKTQSAYQSNELITDEFLKVLDNSLNNNDNENALRAMYIYRKRWEDFKKMPLLKNMVNDIQQKL